MFIFVQFKKFCIMASSSFVLKEKKSKTKTPIFFLFRYNSKRVKISTKLKVNPEYWNFKKQRVILTSEINDSQEINNKLNQIERSGFDIYNNFTLEYKREPEVNELKVLFSKKMFHDGIIYEKPTNKTFFDFFDDLIKVRKENKKVSRQRISIYRNTYNLLKEYERETKDLIAFERFDELFSVNFKSFLENKKKFAPNTIHKHFNVIRTVLNNAVTKNYNVNKEYKSSDFMPEKEETFEIALTIEEVEALQKFDFSNNKKYERVRDLFVVACYTGLRFSDLKRLKKENLKGKYLSIVQEKTKKKNPLPVIIPILEPVKEIFEKYNYNLPNEISNQKMNLYLKEMAKETGLFDDEVTYNRIIGGKQITISHSKYNEIKTHTARRTFCTMSYLLGVPTQAIMAISGHKTEKSFLKYLKVENEEHAERTLKIWEEYYLSNKKETGKVIQINTSA